MRDCRPIGRRVVDRNNTDRPPRGVVPIIVGLGFVFGLASADSTVWSYRLGAGAGGAILGYVVAAVVVWFVRELLQRLR